MTTLLPFVSALIHRQINSLFPLEYNKNNIESSDMLIALQRFQACLEHISGKYYAQHLNQNDFYHSDKYAVFLYYLAHTLYSNDKIDCATQIYCLNKTLHSVDMFYEVELPHIFMLTHPVGSVLGRAEYSDYFCAYHNCGVGSSKKNGITHYPSFGQGILMYGGSRVIGQCKIGDNVIFGANAFIIDTDVPSNSVVVGSYPHHRILPNSHNVIKDIFGLHPNTQEVARK
nr:hypothetical protein [uncultured Helicobacter sp.]